MAGIQLPRGAVPGRLGKSSDFMRKAKREREAQRQKERSRHQPRPMARTHNVRLPAVQSCCSSDVGFIRSSQHAAAALPVSHTMQAQLLRLAHCVQLLESFGEALLRPLPLNIQADLRARQQELRSLLARMFLALQRLLNIGEGVTP